MNEFIVCKDANGNNVWLNKSHIRFFERAAGIDKATRVHLRNTSLVFPVHPDEFGALIAFKTA